MARLNIRTPSRNIYRKNKTWFAGEIAERGCYVCRHCNSQTLIENGNHLPLCPTCYGRRFTLQ